MTKCVSTGEREWTEQHWTYRGAAPIALPGSAGQIGLAYPAYVFRRRFKLKYKCCSGADTRYLWVDGNYAYYIERAYDAAYPIVNVSLPLPIGGLLGELAWALGADVPIAQWWVDPNGPNGEKPGVDDSQEPNGVDRLVPVPEADCGHWVQIGERKIPWEELPPSEDTPGGGGSTTSGPTLDPGPEDERWKPTWEPRHKWPPEMNSCCTGIDPTPSLTVVQPPPPRVYAKGGSWFADLKITVSHPCGLKEEPIVTVRIYRHNHAEFVPKSGVKTTQTADGKGYDLDWSGEQVSPRTESGAGLKVLIHAVSKCEGVLDATYSVRRNWKAGEQVPAGGHGRWRCTATGQIDVLAGGQAFPACSGDWVYVGPE